MCKNIIANRFIERYQVFFYGKRRNTHYLRSFFIGTAFQLYKLIYLSLLGWKLLNGLMLKMGMLFQLQAFFNVFVVLFGQCPELLQQLMIAFQLPEKIVHQVLGYAVNISLKIFANAFTGAFLPDAGKQFLNELPGLLMVFHHPQDVQVKAGTIMIVKRGERFFTTQLHFLNQ